MMPKPASEISKWALSITEQNMRTAITREVWFMRKTYKMQYVSRLNSSRPSKLK